MQQTINDMYTGYLSGDITREALEGMIYNFYIYNQEKTCLCHWKRDDYEDYISWFYPRLKKAIDNYHDTGSSFEAFTGRYFLVSSKEYRGRNASNTITEYSAWRALIPDMYAHEEPPVYIHNNVEYIINNLTIDKRGRKNTRRLLALVLKCYYYISDNFAEKIASKLDINKKELLEMLKKLRDIRQKKDDAIYLMKERINTQFIRCLIYEKKMLIVKENTNAFIRLSIKHKKARERLDRMRKRIKSVRTEATNKQIAQIIGISKGTVDASLYRLKTKWQLMSEKANLN